MNASVIAQDGEDARSNPDELVVVGRNQQAATTSGGRSLGYVPHVFGVFISVVQFATIVNALVRSLRARFITGAIAAVLRAVLLLSGVIGVVLVRLVLFPGSDVPAPTAPTLVALVATVLGPAVSFVVLWVAYRRMRNVPAAEEERVSRPFNAWLPVALFDAAFVVINGLAWAATRNV